MSGTTDWSLSNEIKKRFITALTKELAPLRAKVGISQGELAHLVGVSRQTYCAVEGGKKPMSWNTYLSLVLFFDYNQATHQMIRTIGAFPGELIERFNHGKEFMKYNLFLTNDKQANELPEMIFALDEQGFHTLKMVLLMEYGRCTNSMEEVLKKAAESDNQK